MPIDSLHPQYEFRSGDWKRCRDALDGTRAIKAAKTTYLPRHQFDANEYADFVERALWYGATGRTLQGLAGAVFRRDPVIEPADWPEGAASHWDDIALDDMPLEVFIRAAFEEVLAVGRCAVLVDYPTIRTGDVDGSTVALPPEEDRPYWIRYRAEDVLNWRTQRFRGTNVLSLAVLRETDLEPDPDDPWAVRTVERFRELLLDGGIYRQRIWIRDRGSWTLEAEITPVRQGSPLEFIPLTFLGPTSIGPDVAKPPLLDLVDINVSHYRTTADLEHARHWTAIPMLYVFSNALPENPEIRFGSSEALTLSDSNAKAGFIEYRGEGIGALERALTEKEQKMAAIGARLLDEPKAGVETAAAMEIRLSGEQSFLQSVARSVSHGLTRCLRHHLWWAGASDLEIAAATIGLNQDFVARRLSDSDLRGLVLAYQSGLMSRETFVHQLKEGEILPQDRSIEQEMELIRAAEGALLPAGEG